MINDIHAHPPCTLIPCQVIYVFLPADTGTPFGEDIMGAGFSSGAEDGATSLTPCEPKREYGFFLKVITIGDSDVGKSAIITRYKGGYFYSSYTSTIGGLWRGGRRHTTFS